MRLLDLTGSGHAVTLWHPVHDWNTRNRLRAMSGTYCAPRSTPAFRLPQLQLAGSAKELDEFNQHIVRVIECVTGFRP